MNTIKTKVFHLKGTQAEKISGTGFGSKKDCLGYMQSSSLSPLNEKFFIMLFHEVIINKNKMIELQTATNYFQFSVYKVRRNAVSTQIQLFVQAFNVLRHQPNLDAGCWVFVEYKNGGEEKEVKPRKDAGLIKSVNYDGTEYKMAEYELTSTGVKIPIKWYFQSFEYEVYML